MQMIRIGSYDRNTGDTVDAEQKSRAPNHRLDGAKTLRK